MRAAVSNSSSVELLAFISLSALLAAFSIRLIEKYQAELKALQGEYEVLKETAETEKQIEDDVDEYIRRLRSYAGAEELTRQMALDLIEYITIDRNPDKRSDPRDIHIYYKLIDKPLKNKRNALAD